MSDRVPAAEAGLVTPQAVGRLAVVVMALFPMLWGFLGVLNDLTDFRGTAENAVRPMLAMTDTYGNPLQTARAITAPWVAPVALAGIMAAEGLAGLFGLVGLVLMVRNFRGSAADFGRGKAWMMLGCLVAVLVWGVGFMVIGGDWFLSWQAKTDPLSNQLSGMIYFLPCALGLVVAMVHRET